MNIFVIMQSKALLKNLFSFIICVSALFWLCKREGSKFRGKKVKLLRMSAATTEIPRK